MPYRDAVDAHRTRLREVERELAELDVRLAELDELADRRRALGAEAARLRQLLHPIAAGRTRSLGRNVVLVLTAAIVIAGVTAAMIYHRPEPIPPQPPHRVAVTVSRPARAVPPAPPVTDPGCAAALAHPDDARDDVLRACGARQQLGRCHLYDAGQCPTCACREYVGLDGACGKGGCGEPLNGTGCATGSFYRGVNNGVNWSCATGDEAACMLRRLAAWGYCTGERDGSAL